jgi:hypothetical protein
MLLIVQLIANVLEQALIKQLSFLSTAPNDIWGMIRIL